LTPRPVVTNKSKLGQNGLRIKTKSPDFRT